MNFFSIRRVLAVALLILAGLSTVSVAEDLKPEILEALNQGDTARAESFLKKEIGLDPSYHVNYYTLGRIYFSRDQWSKAREQFELALGKKDKHWESLFYLGHCQLKLGDLDGAAKSMERGLSKARDLKPQFQNGYGQVLMAREEYDASLSYLLQAVNAEPNNAEYHINVGDAYYYMDVPYTAVEEYAKALALDTASTEVYFHWAEACLTMKDFTCALEKLRIVLSKDSTYVPAWSRAGEIYFKAAMSAHTRQDRDDRFKDAIGSYRRYISLSNVQPDSSTVRVYFELGMAYAGINGYEDAAEAFAKVLAIPYEPKDIYFYYGKSLVRTQNYQLGAEMLKKHREWAARQNESYSSRIDGWEIDLLLGDCYFYREPKDFYTAVNYYKTSLEGRPDQQRVIQNVAIGLHSLKDYRDAIKYYNQRIEMGIDSATASYVKNAAYCALNLANGGGDEDDLEDIDDIMGDQGGDPVDGDMTNVDDGVDYLQVAADYLSQYLEYRPDDDKIVLQLATTYLYSLSDCENGVKWFRRLMELDPNNCDAKKSLGFAYFGGLCTKNFSQALTYLKQADQCLNPDGTVSDVDIILWIAQAHHLRAVEIAKDVTASKADYKQAFDWYNKVLKFDANNAEAKKGVEQTAYEY